MATIICTCSRKIKFFYVPLTMKSCVSRHRGGSRIFVKVNKKGTRVLIGVSNIESVVEKLMISSICVWLCVIDGHSSLK